MTNQGFLYEVKIRLQFTKREAEILMDLSASHYDGRCRAAGRVGGYVYGIFNHPHQPWTLTWHQVDTMCKIMENAQTDDARALLWDVRETLSSMSKEQRAKAP